MNKLNGLLIALFILIISILTISGCSQGNGEEQLVDLKIEGMTCNHCVQTVTTALQEVEGVDTAIVDLENDLAHVKFKDAGNPPSNEALVAAVTKKGYGAEVLEKE